MKFACAKCNHILTNDLYLTHRLQRTPVIADDGTIIVNYDGKPKLETTIKPGSFVRYRFETIGSWASRLDRKRDILKAKQEGRPNHGTFTKIFREWTDRKISINKDDAVGCFLYPFKEGYGCCDNHYIEVECGNCYTQVGWEFSDCYESLSHIQLIDGKVVHDFTRRPTIASPKAYSVTLAPDAELTTDQINRNVDLAMKAFKQGKSKPFVDPIDMQELE